MKITIEIPDTTSCIFLNYVYSTNKENEAMDEKKYKIKDSKEIY